MTDLTDSISSWLPVDDLENARAKLPIVYVDAIPVRVDESGRVLKIGLLLRGRPDGSISRAVISGRVLFGERVRDALLRHIEKDLGPMALPQIPTSPTPFTVAEYFPDPDKSGFHDPRQHAVSLVYVVPVKGDLGNTARSSVTTSDGRNDWWPRFTGSLSVGAHRFFTLSRTYFFTNSNLCIL